MDAGQRIERTLDNAVAYAEAPGAPPRLAEAIRYAVFPGGHRIRPRLCLAVAAACGDDDPAAAESAAAAIELLHCASLVHDDLPCFDDAETRRQKPTVHVAFGEPLAVLTGDALIVLAFETLARGAARNPHRLAALVGLVARAVGSPAGIVAGQAWESEEQVALSNYQQAKTGALFAAATVAGAAAAGASPLPWRLLGECLGEAYQVADDLRDVACRQEEIGKPAGRDATLGRPNAALLLGMGGALERLKRLSAEAIEVIPTCPGADALRAEIAAQTRLFLPASLAHEFA
ncbi:polyprenyl synthetase family protein [Methylobacterium sp. WL30]|uniref:polyprenyl synthetase family protein n=1 Tax=unclassified Methylobacterium TaxID=2615210 RepID=UPI0011C9F277|nr:MULTISPECIES: polyprenyl synthetase family protein [unclassified Methylobacterium]MCJ2114652.1 polyprenyl synthetase family protein [Methylobacterium sp. E-025]TXN38712.1 polyprenyl synthetase family protein [Methylobacterium sp. WL93]TXN48494.1 polyprenyl synthetase family protein [Methylobacterium sp. WL119]TXN64827.1 polyprenyl synthetase family protein [Methylobacterium sp. WL30]